LIITIRINWYCKRLL